MLTPEEELLLLAARLDLPAEKKARMGELLKKDLHWPVIRDLSQKLSVQSLLYRHLHREEFVYSVPREIIQTLKKTYRDHTVGNLHIYGQIISLLADPALQEIPLVLLKGAFLARWVYRSVGLRPMRDIDLLCRREDQQVIWERLIELGFFQKVPQSSLHAEVDAVTIPHLPGLFHTHRLKIELHLDIYPGIYGPAKEIRMEEVWKATTPLELDGHHLRRLAPEDLLLHLLLHANHHIEIGALALYWLCDIHEILTLYADRYDWDLFSARVHVLRAGSATASLLKLINEYWESPVPEGLLNTLCNNVRSLSMTEIIRERGVGKKERRKKGRRYVLRLKEVADQCGRMAVPRYVVRTLFPTRGYLEEYYSKEDIHSFYHFHYLFDWCGSTFESVWYNIKSLLRKTLPLVLSFKDNRAEEDKREDME